MIQSFHNQDTDRLFHGERVLAYHGFAERAYDKLVELNRAKSLQQLYIRRGNRLEALSGDRAGQHSIASTVNGASAFAGTMATPTTLK